MVSVNVSAMKETNAPRSALASANACGKIVLFGEHAVVYGRPALAAPVKVVQATATVDRGQMGQGLWFEAAGLGKRSKLMDAPADDPLAAAVRLTMSHLNLTAMPDWLVTISSTIPIASGLGSGAAVSTALIRALAEAAGRDVTLAEVSALVFEVEKLYHGTPSGIDNTVVAFERTVYFIKGQEPQFLTIERSPTFIVADTGVASLTKIVVDEVRRGWLREPDRYKWLFDRIAQVVTAARAALVQGDEGGLGSLMNENHELLHQLGVSSGVLERLRNVALAAGARGAKLSGAGKGGNLLALVASGDEERVAVALRAAGAKNIIVTQVA